MDWQQIAALGIVLAAFLWLLRTQVFRRGGKAGCGGCGAGCGSVPTPSAQRLIAPEELTVLSPPTPHTPPPEGAARQ